MSPTSLALLLATAVSANDTEPTALPDEPDTSPTIIPAPRTVRIHYTGSARGIGPHRPPTEVLRALTGHAVDVNAQFTGVRAVHGVLAQGTRVLRVDDTMAGAVAFLDGQAPTCSLPTPVPGYRAPLGQLQLDVDTPPDWLGPLLDDTPFIRRTCTHPSGAVATLTAPADGPLPSWALSEWETRDALVGSVALAGTTVPFVAIQHPIRDHSRTAQWLTTALNDDPYAIYVDAGEALDGASSVHDGQPSVHRATSLSSFERLGPKVLVPGSTELVVGARAFIEEQAPRSLPYIATNWDTTDPVLDLPPSRTVTIDHPDGEVRIAFIGILDPALQDAHAGLAEEGVTITDPIAAVQPVVTALEQAEPPPHAIVALTTASGDVQERIRRELRGVDLLVGDPSMATFRTEAREVSLRALDSSRKGAAVTLPMDGLATAELTLDSVTQHLMGVRTVPVDVRPADPTDPIATAAITGVRADVYPHLEAPLLGAAPDAAPLDTWPTESWEQLVCEAVRTGANADIAVLGALPPPPASPGPLTELQALDSLAMIDTLEVHKVQGTRIQRLADRLDGVAPVTCGVPVGQAVFKVGARWLDPDRVYRVVTSSKAAATTPIGEILRSQESSRVLDQPTVRPLPSSQVPDQPATLRAVAIDRMRTVRDDTGGPDTVAQALLVDGPSTLDPLWLFRVRRVGVQSQSFQGVEDDRFAEVPETLATSPSSYTLGSEADLALEHSTTAIWSDLRAVATFSRVRAGEEDPEELADDLVFSTSHSLPGLAFPTVPPLRMMPFSEVAYDTEFTAIEEVDGGTGIAQSDLSLTFGLSAQRSGPIRGLRIGGFANRDMARLDEKPTEFGGRLDWETFQSFGPSVKWTTTADVHVFADTPDDDASDLRLRAQGDTRVLLPLATWLDLGVYGQVFALRGRTVANDRLGVSTTWGVTLDMAGAFAL